MAAAQVAARRPQAVSSGDMSRNGKTAPAPVGGWLDGDQQRAWLAYIRVQLRLAYEMNRQLLADSGMSLPDYDVLTGLSVAEGGRMSITVLAAQIGWERSRVSHHVRRMSARGLVTCGRSAKHWKACTPTSSNKARSRRRSTGTRRRADNALPLPPRSCAGRQPPCLGPARDAPAANTAAAGPGSQYRPPLERSRLRPVGNEVLVIRVAAYAPGGH